MTNIAILTGRIARDPDTRQRFWWQRGYFSTPSGNITDDIIMRYLERHTHKDGFSPQP